jgi:hypothetical protein
VQFDETGKYLREYKSEGAAINPQKLKVKDGKIYIADANSDRPLVWNIGGELTNVRTSNRWFSTANGTTSPLKIKYTLTQPAAVAIGLVPQAAAGIAAMGSTGTVIVDASARAIGPTTEVWTGQLVGVSASSASNETAVPEGQYTLKVAAAFGDYIKSGTTEVVIDNTAPTITLNRAPPAVSPNSDNINDSMTINYTVSDNLSPTAEVKLTLWKNNRLVEILSQAQIYNTEYDNHLTFLIGHLTFAWDGKIGPYVSEGSYILQLQATDLAGNTQTATTDVLVDIQPPRIKNVRV